MYTKIVEINDTLTESFFEKQVNDVNSRYFGGVIFYKTGIPSPSHTGTGSVLGSWVSSFINPDSKYHHDNELATRIEKAFDYMLDQQHDDGTISPGWTNFHSPPDTGFLITGFSHIYHLLKEDNGPRADELTEKVRTFLERTIPAMLTGGGHTPNHRWVLSSALAHLYAIFGKAELLERAEQWLDEGIDITEDGEWTERSNGIYNSVSNIFLYHTARILNKPRLLDYVRKNLDMMMYLVHPDGEIVTDYSGRQDFGNTYDLTPYHLIYRLMAYHDNNPAYAAMSDWATENLTDMGPVNNHIMLGYLMFPFIKEEEKVTNTPLPTEYEVFLNKDFPIADFLKKMEQVGHGSRIEHSSMHESFGAPIVRYRQNDESVTIMSKNASLFSLRKGSAKLLGVRLSSNFSPGVIEFDTIQIIDGGYRLKKTMEKGYNGPIQKQYLSHTEEKSIWYLLPHQHRELTHNQTFNVEVDILRTGAGEWDVRIKSDDREDVLLQIEFLFDNSGSIQGDVEAIKENSYFWKSGELTYQSGENSISIHTGNHEHWLDNTGKVNEVSNVQTVKVNLISPIDRVFRLVSN